MYVLNFIYPFVMLIVAYILKRHPVKDMSLHNGYNTPTARKSQAHWDYAQSIAPDIFIRIGIVLVIIELMLSVVLYVLKATAENSVILGSVIGAAFILYGFYVTDTKIKRQFLKNKDT